MKLVVLTATKRFPDDFDTSTPISAATQGAHEALEADGWELSREIRHIDEPIADPKLGRAPTDETTVPLLRRLQATQRRDVGNAKNFFVLRQMPAPSFIMEMEEGNSRGVDHPEPEEGTLNG